MEISSDLPSVLKRRRVLQPFRAYKLLHTLKILSWDLDTASMDLPGVVDAVQTSVATQISSHELQDFTASTVAMLTSRHPDYGRLAGRMLVANIHKTVDKSFCGWVQTNAASFKIHPGVLEAVRVYGDDLDDAIVHARDYDIHYGSVQTLMKGYLKARDDMVAERPQFLYMRVAIEVNRLCLPAVLKTYDALSRQLYTHATPVLYNAGTSKRNFASCFLYQPDASSLRSLLMTPTSLDALWLAEGGVGLSLGAVPGERQAVSPQTNPGVMALMRIYDSHAAMIGHSGSKRPSAATVYLPIWHTDVRPFLQCRTSRVGPSARVTNLYPALWIPDLFMQRLRDDGLWSLFDPPDAPALLVLYGEEFTEQYEAYEQAGVPHSVVSAVTLFKIICDAQRESGAPFIIYQDAVNKKNNQSHVGMIQSSNLCTEIMQFSSPEETAVCTLASIALPRFVRPDLTFDYDSLHALTKLVVHNTDSLIERGEYPTPASQLSAVRYRAIGVGVQGFADALHALAYPYHSERARQFNIDAFETIYHAALEASNELAEKHGPYPAWKGSPASRGILQLDMWEAQHTGRYDFDTLRTRIGRFGLRNAHLTAQMPTASTAQLLGNSEGIDLLTSNITTHRTIAGEYTEVCPRLVRDLINIGSWNDTVRESILTQHGSLAHISGVPAQLKELYRTVWEVNAMDVIDMAADRAPYIDQSQSLTLNVQWPTTDIMRSLHVRGWQRGLKTGMYYLRSRAPTYPTTYGVPLVVEPFRLTVNIIDEPPPLEPATPSLPVDTGSVEGSAGDTQSGSSHGSPSDEEDTVMACGACEG